MSYRKSCAVTWRSFFLMNRLFKSLLVRSVFRWLVKFARQTKGRFARDSWVESRLWSDDWLRFVLLLSADFQDVNIRAFVRSVKAHQNYRDMFYVLPRGFFIITGQVVTIMSKGGIKLGAYKSRQGLLQFYLKITTAWSKIWIICQLWSGCFLVALETGSAHGRAVPLRSPHQTQQKPACPYWQPTFITSI